MGHIVLKDVVKRFGETEVIPPLNLTIEEGEFAVFVGPSGCGKSTLLRIIAGLEDTTEGKVIIDGEVLDENYIQSPPDYTWGPDTVPEDEYLVLGDNRNSSSDSHVWGFLPRENVLGRASKIFWPPARQGAVE